MKKKNKNKKKSQLPFILIFIIGFFILLYPQVSRLYYRVQADQQVRNFDDDKKKLDEKEIKKRIELAKGYNDKLNNVITEDPYEKEKQEEGVKNYAKMLELHEKIGHVQIPIIDVDIPIYAGTSEEVLQKGAGHLEGTSLPIGGLDTHTVITAHSGLPTARLFTDLSQLKKGDKFFIHNLEQTLAYEVDQIKIVEPSEFNDLLIVKGEDYATLLTCTPIMINTHRLLVRGHRIEYNPADASEMQKTGRIGLIYKYGFFIDIAFIVILIYLDIKYFNKRKKLMMTLNELKSKHGGSEWWKRRKIKNFPLS